MATVTRRGKSYSIRVSCGYDMTGAMCGANAPHTVQICTF